MSETQIWMGSEAPFFAAMEREVHLNHVLYPDIPFYHIGGYALFRGFFDVGGLEKTLRVGVAEDGDGPHPEFVGDETCLPVTKPSGKLKKAFSDIFLTRDRKTRLSDPYQSMALGLSLGPQIPVRRAEC